MGYDLNGLGMARPTIQHLTTTRNIVINWYLQTGFKGYDAYQEPSADLDTPEEGYVPDVGFYEIGKLSPSVIIEVDTGKKGIMQAQTKVSYYLQWYEVEEVFIYDYVTGQWERHTPNGKSSTSESEVLGVYLEDLIDLPAAQPLSGIKPPLILR